VTMTIPTIPTMPAGYIAQAADMNNLAYAVQFLLGKPISRVYDTTGTQAITTASVLVTWGAASFDPDGMWSSGTPTVLTVQTPGFYNMDYCVQGAASPTINMNTGLLVTTGPNNPAGSGISTPAYPGYGGGSQTGGQRCSGHASGVIPWYLYIGDTVGVNVVAGSAGMTLSTGVTPSFLALELVSV
jgi:hypothetical protein